MEFPWPRLPHPKNVGDGGDLNGRFPPILLFGIFPLIRNLIDRDLQLPVPHFFNNVPRKPSGGLAPLSIDFLTVS